jgi:hypothetical protein
LKVLLSYQKAARWDGFIDNFSKVISIATEHDVSGMLYMWAWRLSFVIVARRALGDLSTSQLEGLAGFGQARRQAILAACLVAHGRVIPSPDICQKYSSLRQENDLL